MNSILLGQKSIIITEKTSFRGCILYKIYDYL